MQLSRRVVQVGEGGFLLRLTGLASLVSFKTERGGGGRGALSKDVPQKQDDRLQRERKSPGSRRGAPEVTAPSHTPSSPIPEQRGQTHRGRLWRQSHRQSRQL